MTDGFSAVAWLRPQFADDSGGGRCCKSITGSGSWTLHNQFSAEPYGGRTVQININLGWAKSASPYPLQPGDIVIFGPAPPGY